MRPRLTRRRFLLGLGGIAGLSGLGYFRGLEPEWLQVTRTRIVVPSASAQAQPTLRVVHLSDLHADLRWVSLAHLRHAVQRALAEKPDIVCLTGDFITSRYDHFADYAEVLRPLVRAAPTFACLGNHDGGAWAAKDSGYRDNQAVREFLRAAGIQLLHNRTTEFLVQHVRWQIVGVGDFWAGECRPDEAFATAPPRAGAPRLLLNHNPDAKTILRAYDWDVMLCGHTHGGQIGIAPLARRLAPVTDKRFIAGLYRWEERPLFITRGIGNLHGVRIFCRPEISVLEIG